MLRSNSFIKLAAGALVSLTFAHGCSSKERGRDPSLLDSKPRVLDQSEEAQRLSELQKLRVFHRTAGTFVDVSAEELTSVIGLFCGAKFGLGFAFEGICGDFGECEPHEETSGTNGNSACTCSERACSMLLDLCRSQTLLDLAAPRSGPHRLEWEQPADHQLMPDVLFPQGTNAVDIPPQALASNAAMLREATVVSRDVVAQAAEGLQKAGDECFNLHVLDYNGLNHSRILERGSEESHVMAELFANSYAEGYRLHGEALGKAVDAIISVADWQRSHPSLQVQVERSVQGEQLSRAEAAHLLVGGTSGLPFVDQHVLCTSPELSGAAQRAMAVLRDAALPPDTLRFDSIETLMFNLVRRMQALGRIDVSAGEEQLLASLDLTRDDFAEARSYLNDEFLVYSRSLDPQIEIREPTLFDGETFFWYAATGARTPTREAPFYGSIARSTISSLTYTQANEEPRSVDDLRHPGRIPGTQDPGNYADFVDAVGSMARYISRIEYPSAIDGFIKPAMTAVVADAYEERIGRWAVCVDAWDRTWFSDVYGIAPEAGLIVVNGEEGLECGVQGTIEGQRCDLGPWIKVRLNGPVSNPKDFDTAAVGTPRDGLVTELTSDQHVYLLKPRRPDAPEAAGQYVALAGSRLPMVPPRSQD